MRINEIQFKIDSNLMTCFGIQMNQQVTAIHRHPTIQSSSPRLLEFGGRGSSLHKRRPAYVTYRFSSLPIFWTAASGILNFMIPVYGIYIPSSVVVSILVMGTCAHCAPSLDVKALTDTHGQAGGLSNATRNSISKALSELLPSISSRPTAGQPQR